MKPYRTVFDSPSSALIYIVMALSFSGCSLPKIIILHDPLTAVEHDNLGRIYESQGDLALAAGQYRLALQQDRKHVPSLLLLGDISYRLKDYSSAESAYTKALKLAPDNGDVRNNLAWAYIQQGRKLNKAKELITQALTLNTDHRPYYLDTLGVVLLKLGNVTEAVTVLKESVDMIPKDRPELLAEAQGHLAEAYKSAGDEIKYREIMERQKNTLHPSSF